MVFGLLRLANPKALRVGKLVFDLLTLTNLRAERGREKREERERV